MEILREVDGSCREWYIYDYLEPAVFRNIMFRNTHSFD